MLKRSVTNYKSLVAVLMIAALVISMACPAFADDADTTASEVDGLVAPFIDLINTILQVTLILVGALGTIYCVFLGVKFAKAEEPQDREKAKQHLKNAIIGFVLIFVLMLALRLLMPVMVQWAGV